VFEFTLYILFKIFCFRKGLQFTLKTTVEAPVG